MQRVDVSFLKDVVRYDAGLVATVQLEPIGGFEEKIQPPTYAGRRYHVEKRRTGTEVRDCVVLDSVPSQANRMELALKEHVHERGIKIPSFWLSFDGTSLADRFAPGARLSSFDLPGRAFDMFFMSSEINAKSFYETDLARRLGKSNLRNATPLLTLCPTCLIYGAWDSMRVTAQGGLEPQFPRIITSEIVGYDPVEGGRSEGRLSPIPISSSLKLDVDDGANKAAWRFADRGKKKPSEFMLGSVTPTFTAAGETRIRRDEVLYSAGGVTVSSIKRTVVVSSVALNNLRFPVEKGSNGPVYEEEIELSCRALLLAMALAGAVLQHEDGYHLRSGCDLFATTPLVFERVSRLGPISPNTFELSAAEAVELVRTAISEVKDAGVGWPEDGYAETVFTPSKKLVELIEKSMAAYGAGEDMEES